MKRKARTPLVKYLGASHKSWRVIVVKHEISKYKLTRRITFAVLKLSVPSFVLLYFIVVGYRHEIYAGKILWINRGIAQYVHHFVAFGIPFAAICSSASIIIFAKTFPKVGEALLVFRKDHRVAYEILPIIAGFVAYAIYRIVW
jgi:hypothetical protein